MEKDVAASGGKTSPRVTAATTILVAGYAVSEKAQTRKYRKAKRLGVRIVSERDCCTAAGLSVQNFWSF